MALREVKELTNVRSYSNKEARRNNKTYIATATKLERRKNLIEQQRRAGKLKLTRSPDTNRRAYQKRNWQSSQCDPRRRKSHIARKQSLGAAKETQTLEDPSNEHIPTALKHQSHFN
ncbi:hypothetical protein NC652_031341 [Populus alba x Populus x berolinensis]|nr:hypothetical protein NC652_031341 [Populus alba x Populus x berolinensis]